MVWYSHCTVLFEGDLMIDDYEDDVQFREQVWVT